MTMTAHSLDIDPAIELRATQATLREYVARVAELEAAVAIAVEFFDRGDYGKEYEGDVQIIRAALKGA